MTTPQQRIIDIGTDIVGFVNDRYAVARDGNEESSFNPKYRNILRSLAGDPMEVIPFTNNERPMPFEIRFFYEINEMSSARLNLFLDGYEIPRIDRSGNPLSVKVKKVKLAIHLGVPTKLLAKAFSI